MSTFNSSLNSLLVFSESLNDLSSLKKHVEYYKKCVGLMDIWSVYYSEVLIVLPYFPLNSLSVNSVLEQTDFYERQAKELSKFLYSEFNLTYEKIHMESGSLEKLVTQYVYQYQIDKVILDLDCFEGDYFPPIKRKERKEYFEQDIDSLMSLYGI
ncbi:MAG: hypothetical protein JSS53_05810 [Proteobacteria bacterium]|nr:hypothetical protein [Pseudomonadota bacterium]